MATLLFLHGLAGHGAEWDAVADELAPSADGGDHAWFAPDLRGHQGQAVDPHPLLPESFVDDAVQWLRNDDGANIVVGQSMGGIVATLLAAARPDLVRGLVMVEAGVDALSPDTLASVTTWLNSWPEHFESSHAATNFFGADKPSTPAWVAGLIPTPDGFLPRFDPDTLIQIMKVLAVPDRWAAWRSLQMPTLIVRGVAGSLTVEQAQRMKDEHATPEQVRIAEVFEAGHDVHLDQPAQLAAVLSEFADGVAGSRP